MRATITWGVPPEAWRAFLSACPEATFFHGPDWHLAQSERHGYALDTAVIRFESGESALLPLAVRPRFRGMAREALSGVGGGYGGLVTPRPLGAASVREAYRLVRLRYPDLVVTGNPYAPSNTVPEAGQAVADVTQVIPVLAPDAQLGAMSASRRNAVRRAVREPFRLEVVEGLVPDDVARFYALYAAHAATWQVTRWVHDEAYFRALARHAGGQLVLFMVYHGDMPVAYRLLAVGRPLTISLHIGRDKDYESREVSPYLMAESLAWCHAQGVERLDMLASGALEGVRAYKASFGAVDVPFEVVRQESWRAAALTGLWRLTHPAA